ncbi:hypothetical protein XELAEV_18044751mg, partial [Xenopus laevis]
MISTIFQATITPDPWAALFGRCLQLSRNHNKLATQICSATRCVPASMWKGPGLHQSAWKGKFGGLRLMKKSPT